MSDIWDTKDGRRRVRRDPPTVEDAVLAAQGLTDDLDGQIEIVMSLMPVSAEEARGAILKMGQPQGHQPLHDCRPRRSAAHRGGRTPRAAPDLTRTTASAGYPGAASALRKLQPAPVAGVGYDAPTSPGGAR